MDPYAPALQHKCKRGFFSTVAWGASMTIITAIVCGTGLGLYGLRIVDTKSDNVLASVQQLLGNLPEIQKNLPPVLADALNDERRPDYLSKIKITAGIVSGPNKRGDINPSVEITNTGDEVVSMLPLRITLTDAQGGGIAQRTRMGATPLGVADEDWPGPLMPGATRKIVQRFSVERERGSNPGEASDYQVACEVTDVRIWKPAGPVAKQAALAKTDQD